MAIQRREFLHHATHLVIPLFLNFQIYKPQKIRIGLIADIHKDLMYDADARLANFLKAAQKRKPDMASIFAKSTALLTVGWGNNTSGFV